MTICSPTLYTLLFRERVYSTPSKVLVTVGLVVDGGVGVGGVGGGEGVGGLGGEGCGGGHSSGVLEFPPILGLTIPALQKLN